MCRTAASSAHSFQHHCKTKCPAPLVSGANIFNDDIICNIVIRQRLLRLRYRHCHPPKQLWRPAVWRFRILVHAARELISVELLPRAISPLKTTFPKSFDKKRIFDLKYESNHPQGILEFWVVKFQRRTMIYDPLLGPFNRMHKRKAVNRLSMLSAFAMQKAGRALTTSLRMH